MSKKKLWWMMGTGLVLVMLLAIFMIACEGPEEPSAPTPARNPNVDWQTSGHANAELAVLEAAVENRGATASHCGRCHASQGFVAWHSGDLTKRIQGAAGDATVDELKALGLTIDAVQPQTCDTCHGQPIPGSTTDRAMTLSIRISGNTPKLPSGFSVTNAGAGALCMTCHNTRNGARSDAVPPPNYSAPHTAAQADVLMGKNSYLVRGERSPHSFLQDTCVTCHMAGSPPPEEFATGTPTTSHTFRADIEVCSSCHSDVFDGEAFKEATEDSLHELGDAMSAYLMGKLPAEVTVKDYTPHTFNGKEYDVKSDNIILAKDNIASVEPTEPHGQQGFLFKLKSPLQVTYSPKGESPHTVSIKELEVQLADVTTDGKTALIPTTDVLVKAGWNYFLLHGDNSGGIHNPPFVNAVLEATITALR